VTERVFVFASQYDAVVRERDRWIRAFNRLEKAATNHVQGCIDADELAHVHKVVMRDLHNPSDA
jgi:hypothetical protein